MACISEQVAASIRNCAKKFCGSLKTAAIILGIIFGGVGLVAGGADTRYDFIPLVVTRAAHLLFYACLALVWGISIGRVELLLGYLSAVAIVVPTSIVGVISSCFIHYYLDPAYPALAITFVAVIPVHMVIVHGLIQEMKGVENSSPPKDGWIQQNLTAASKLEEKEKENLVQHPAVFAPVNAAQIA